MSSTNEKYEEILKRNFGEKYEELLADSVALYLIHRDISEWDIDSIVASQFRESILSKFEYEKGIEYRRLVESFDSIVDWDVFSKEVDLDRRIENGEFDKEEKGKVFVDEQEITEDMIANESEGTTANLFCAYCGKKLNVDAKFCDNCGKRTANPQTTNRKKVDIVQYIRKFTLKKLLKIIVILIAIILGVNILTEIFRYVSEYVEDYRDPLFSCDSNSYYDPFGLAEENNILGKEISVVLEKYEEGVDYVVYENEYYTSYTFERDINYPAGEQTELVLYTPVGESYIDRIEYHFRTMIGGSNDLMNIRNAREMTEVCSGISSYYDAEPSYSVMYDFDIYDITKEEFKEFLRDDVKGLYNVIWEDEDMNIALSVSNIYDEKLDSGSVSFNLREER